MLWWAGDNHCDSALSLLPPIFAVILLYAIEKKKNIWRLLELLKFLPKAQIFWLAKYWPFGRQVQLGLHVAAREHLGKQYKHSWHSLKCSTESAVCGSRVTAIPQTWCQPKGTVCSKPHLLHNLGQKKPGRKLLHEHFFIALFTGYTGKFLA